jgi:hypothetical protein
MKSQLKFLCVLLGLAATQVAAKVDDLPGYVDLSHIAVPEDAKESIEVNLKKPLLRLAAAAVQLSDPELARIIDDIDLIAVTGFTVAQEDMSVFQAEMARIGQQLGEQGWEKAARVREKGGEQFEVYLKAKDEEIVGLLVMGFEKGQEAVFVNLAGRIDPAQIGRIGSRLNISPLDSLHLDQRVGTTQSMGGAP